MELISADDAGVARAARLLWDGGLVAFPTETVYGLGADAGNAAAVRGIFAAKGRPADNPLIVHVAEQAALRTVAATVTPLAEELAGRYWPGPLTVVVDAADALPRETTGGLTTVAVRMPDHPTALALLRRARVPVAAPSANRSGRPSPTTAAHVAADMAGIEGVILDGGPCPLGLESTVVDARGNTPVVLREGSVTREELGLPASGAVKPGVTTPGRSPGTRYRHYRPACRVEIASEGDGPARAAEAAATGAKTGLVAPTPAPEGVTTVGVAGDAEQLARVLYGALRTADERGLEVLVVEAVAEAGVGRAVMDRLRRAAGG